LRVLHVSRFFHPKIGGTENHIADLASALESYGIESTVLATRRHTVGEPSPQVPVERVAAIGPDWFPFPVDIRGVRELIRGSDVVHVHDLRFALELVTALGLAARVPLVFSSHGLVFHTARLHLLKQALWRTYYRALLGRFAALLCVSEQDLALCRSTGLDNARLFPNPVRTAPFEVVVPTPPGRGALLYFGRLAPNKGIDRLAGVLAQAPPSWTLTVVGTSEDRYADHLARTLAAVGDRVAFRGEVPEAELPSLIAAHDCVVLPSRTEGFGITLIEALATGVPVVASDIAPYREIASSDVALVDFDRHRDAVDAITTAIETWDPISAKTHAHGFSWECRGPDFVALYEHVAR
jgi:glycosyltransferase involved in cell wall biosynthesis